MEKSLGARILKLFHPHIIFWVLLVSVTILSLVPSPPQIKNPFRGMDKVEHALAYASLGFFRCLGRLELDKKRPILRVVIFLGIFGGLIEVAQIYTGRTPEMADLAADIIGAIIGATVAFFVTKLLIKK